MSKKYPKRSREEILAWLQRARDRQAAWEERVHAKWREQERLKQQAEDSILNG